MRSGALRDSSELLRRQRVGSRRSLPFPSQPPRLGARRRAPARGLSRTGRPAGGPLARPSATPAPARARAGAARALPVAAAPHCLLCVLARRR